MPVNIYNEESENRDTIEYLCDGNWELPGQIHELEEWLKSNQNIIPKGKYSTSGCYEVQ
ncbi:hypothetical protein [Chamaesiphon sp.]|uniref:hypothetical protein n=1 Tax=Chamaesiphon sp. TaxID=2814140 RepID=UPI003593137D